VTLKDFWLRQMMLMVGVPFVIFFMVTRLTLVPILHHFAGVPDDGGQHAVTALMLACVLGAACAGLSLLMLVLRAGVLAKKLKSQ
jgi:hypothetical protein